LKEGEKREWERMKKMMKKGKKKENKVKKGLTRSERPQISNNVLRDKLYFPFRHARALQRELSHLMRENLKEVRRERGVLIVLEEIVGEKRSAERIVKPSGREQYESERKRNRS